MIFKDTGSLEKFQEITLKIKRDDNIQNGKTVLFNYLHNKSIRNSEFFKSN